MKTFLTYLDESNALNPQFPYGGSSIGPGLDQYVPVADLNAQSQKEIKKSDNQESLIKNMQTRDELYDVLDYHSFENKLDELFKN